jgi:hypothetical protein
MGHAVAYHEGVHVLGVQLCFEGTAQAGNQPAYGLRFCVCKVSQARDVTAGLDETPAQISAAIRRWGLMAGVDQIVLVDWPTWHPLLTAVLAAYETIGAFGHSCLLVSLTTSC